MSIQEYFSDFLWAKEPYVSSKTLNTYKGQFKGISKLIDVTQELNELSCLNLYHTIINSNLSAASKNTYLRLWRVFIIWTGEDLPRPTLNKTEIIKSIYTKEDLKRLFGAKTNNFVEYRTQTIEILMYDTGLRSSSIRNILVGDVDLEHRIIAVRHNKNGKVQYVPFGCLELKRYMRKRGGNFDDFLFCDIYGHQLSENAFKKAIRQFNRRNGVKLYSAHAFRHNFCKAQIEMGTNVKVLQKLMNHQNLETTMGYYQLWDKDVISQYQSPMQTLQSRRIF